MCLILFAHQAVAEYPLVVAANRDEFFPRPTQHAEFWPDQNGPQQILAGKDLQAGGTWLGINREGRFAAVTNIRDPSQPEQKPRSRGELPVDFLQSSLSALEYGENLRESFDDYAGYNLLVADRSSMVYVNNFESLVRKLEPGIYGLSNALLNSDWPKVQQGRQKLGSLLQHINELRTDELVAMMSDRTQAQDSELPDTGMPLELERELSSAFIHNTQRDYGTRCSTGVIFEGSGRMRFNEQNFDADGSPSSNHFFDLTRQ
ncbi:MAG: NRDE family protein [Pseudomonadales bacterium]|nr:NRDE family protein [Pseudomonadales bacterium]